MNVIFAGAAHTLLFVHLVVGAAAVLLVTSHAVLSVRGPSRALPRVGLLTALAVIAQMLLGLAIYPAYRVHVRVAVLERSAPFAVQLFDFKEHLSALALALVVSAALAGRVAQPPQARWPVAALSCTGAVFIWTAAIIGISVTARHSL